MLLIQRHRLLRASFKRQCVCVVPAMNGPVEIGCTSGEGSNRSLVSNAASFVSSAEGSSEELVSTLCVASCDSAQTLVNQRAQTSVGVVLTYGTKAASPARVMAAAQLLGF